VAKHPPDQPTTAAKHSPESELQPTTMAAKHPPEQHSGKVSASRGAAKHPPTDDQHSLGDVEDTKKRQAQKWILSEKSRRPPPPRASKTTPPARKRRNRRRRHPTNMV